MWFGDQFLAARAPEGVGLCVRPGLLMRLVDGALRARGYARENGIVRAGGLHYAWRGGTLILSASRDYVAKSLEAPLATSIPASGDAEIAVLAPRKALIRIDARETGVAVTGNIHAAISHRTSPLVLAQSYLPDRILAVGVSGWADLFELDSVVLDLACNEAMRNASQRFFGALLKTLPDAPVQAFSNEVQQEGDECALFLESIDASELFPILAVALIVRAKDLLVGRRPWEPLMLRDDVLPYEWNGQPGIIIPWRGAPWALCLSGHGRDWFATSQEPLMARLVEKPPADLNPADVYVSVDAGKLARALEPTLRQAAELEFLPRMNAKDAEGGLFPMLRAIGTLGVVTLRGTAEKDQLNFTVDLEPPADDRRAKAQ